MQSREDLMGTMHLDITPSHHPTYTHTLSDELSSAVSYSNAVCGRNVILLSNCLAHEVNLIDE